MARSYPWVQVCGEQLVGQSPVLGVRESVVIVTLSPVKALLLCSLGVMACVQTRSHLPPR